MFLATSMVCTVCMLEIRIRNWLAVLRVGCFIGCPIETVWEILPIKTGFDQPNAEIGRRIANGKLPCISSTAV